MAHTLFLSDLLARSLARLLSEPVIPLDPKDQWSTRGRALAVIVAAFSHHDSWHCELRSAVVCCANSLICRARACYQQQQQQRSVQRLTTVTDSQQGEGEARRTRERDVQTKGQEIPLTVQPYRHFLSIYAYQLNSLRTQLKLIKSFTICIKVSQREMQSIEPAQEREEEGKVHGEWKIFSALMHLS